MGCRQNEHLPGSQVFAAKLMQMEVAEYMLGLRVSDGPENQESGTRASREPGSVEEVDKVYVICQAGFQNLYCPHHSHALHCICFPLVT